MNSLSRAPSVSQSVNQMMCPSSQAQSFSSSDGALNHTARRSATVVDVRADDDDDAGGVSSENHPWTTNEREPGVVVHNRGDDDDDGGDDEVLRARRFVAHLVVDLDGAREKMRVDDDDDDDDDEKVSRGARRVERGRRGRRRRRRASARVGRRLDDERLSGSSVAVHHSRGWVED